MVESPVTNLMKELLPAPVTPITARTFVDAMLQMYSWVEYLKGVEDKRSFGKQHRRSDGLVFGKLQPRMEPAQ